MSTLARLLRRLYRSIDRDPEGALGLRLQYAGTMTWRVADGMLTTHVAGGPGASLTVALDGYSVGSLASYLAAQPGYSVPYLAGAPVTALPAAALIEGAGNPAESNGDHLTVALSTLYAYLGAVSTELRRAAAAGVAAIENVALPTAADSWLSLHGGYYAVPRQAGEADAAYGQRIIAEVLRPLANNVAIEAALGVMTGGTGTVADAPITNGAYGLFDVGFDLPDTPDPGIYDDILAVTGRMRDAGTQVRAINARRSLPGLTYLGAGLAAYDTAYVYPA